MLGVICQESLHESVTFGTTWSSWIVLEAASASDQRSEGGESARV